MPFLFVYRVSGSHSLVVVVDIKPALHCRERPQLTRGWLYKRDLHKQTTSTLAHDGPKHRDRPRCEGFLTRTTLLSSTLDNAETFCRRTKDRDIDICGVADWTPRLGPNIPVEYL
jgi:hypothetical protein